MKKIVTLCLSLLLLVSLFAGCAKESMEEAAPTTTKVEVSAESAPTTEEEKVEEPKEDVTLTFLMHDNLMYEYFTEKFDINTEYQKIAPHVTIEIEKAKDSGQLEETLKIRYSANELPDIMLIKPYMLSDFEDALYSLNDSAANKNNLFADKYAVNGNIVGIPETAFYEFVFYRKSIFEELGLQIPTTWDEFIAVADTIKTTSQYIPIALGAKDAWPNYPYNEFMPCLETGVGDLWNVMATIDEPFSPGQPFYEAYKKIQRLYDADVFGEDPLGLGFDQAKALFVAKEAAMMAAGQWYISDYTSNGGDINDLGLFFLPTRNQASDPFRVTVMADGFYATPKEGANLEESVAFIEWYFTSEYYPTYLSAKGLGSTVDGIKVDVPLLNEAFDRQEVEYVLYDGGNAEFNKIANAIAFDVKRMGQEMIAGEDLEKLMTKLNEDWKKAKNK
jgi:raffinose/stachyose/melibiose transport system substrate-binding protein